MDFHGSLFAAFGAELVDAKGNITLHTPEIRQVIEYGRQLVKVLPRDVMAYDSASNNRALIFGQSALIFNPPSAWAVAKRDAPQVARDCWTFSAPRGPKGRFVAYNPYFWSIWSFSQNKTAAKELLEYLSEREQVWRNAPARWKASTCRRSTACSTSRSGNRSSRRAAPCSTIPIRPSHHARPHVAGTPAPPDIAVQIYSRGIMPKMFAQLFSGRSIEQSIAWAEEELTGFMR